MSQVRARLVDPVTSATCVDTSFTVGRLDPGAEPRWTDGDTGMPAATPFDDCTRTGPVGDSQLPLALMHQIDQRIDPVHRFGVEAERIGMFAPAHESAIWRPSTSPPARPPGNAAPQPETWRTSPRTLVGRPTGSGRFWAWLAFADGRPHDPTSLLLAGPAARPAPPAHPVRPAHPTPEG